MQLKGLVKIFAVLLIAICIYQLSFTWFVHSHESDMSAKADKWIAANYQSAKTKYPNNAATQALYEDTLKDLKETRLRRLLDSTKGSKIGPFGLMTYRSAKDKELMLGLDLQGGMSVTMEVGLNDLIKSLSNFSKDVAFNKALDSAVARKANSGADLISLFADEVKKSNGAVKLATLFANRSGGTIKVNDSDQKVLDYLRAQSDVAFKNTVKILTKRIDGFGLASPSINPNPTKGIINIELAGIKDPERARQYLQTTANLQFFEVYTLADNQFGESILKADKTLQDYLNGVKATDTAKKVLDTATKVATQVKPDSSSTAKISTLADSNNKLGGKKDSTVYKANENPIRRLIQFTPPTQDKAGKTFTPPTIGYVALKDTGTLNAYLNMELVKNLLPADSKMMYGKIDEEGNEASKNVLTLYAIKTLENGQAKLEGDKVSDSRADVDEKGRPCIKMNMTNEGTRLWAELTTKNAGKPVAIVLDNIVYSAPNVNEPITTGTSQISGSFSNKEASELAEILQSGKLPAPARIVAEQLVGPTLGAEAVKGGSLAFIISFVIIFILMLVYYNTAGWVANIALILNILFTVGVLAALGFTLTSAGIAGLVLTIGMAVDTNVIIFERIKEELNKGKGYSIAVNDGYKRSLAPILDAHVTSFLTAFILFVFGLGPVLGFATTQMIGIILSLFCGILVSRLITDIYASKKGRHFEYFTVISRKIFKHASFKFIEYRKVAYGISVVVLLLGVGSFFNGFDEGVEFAGGRSYTLSFAKPVNPDAIRDDLKASFEGETPVIKTVDKNNTVNITTSYKIHESGKNADSLVRAKLYEGLHKKMPELTTIDFQKIVEQGKSETVLPSISDDLKSGAIKAAIFAMFFICLYIFIRFRDWRYSLGTIVALLHDVFVTLAVFSFARKLVPFPLEIDQHFIAAVLTVIGFSMNDTVIVYDRIREDSKLFPSMSKEQVINTAINQTLSRTIMTSLTVFLTILILFIFGGEVTRGFAFAMLVGVITGTYSSIFVAAPILVDFARKRPLGKAEEKK